MGRLERWQIITWNESISDANLTTVPVWARNSVSSNTSQIILDVRFPRKRKKNNGGVDNKNNIRSNNERRGGRGTQVIASITPLHRVDPFVGITRGSKEVDYKTLAKGFVWIAPVKREIAGPRREANNSY